MRMFRLAPRIHANPSGNIQLGPMHRRPPRPKAVTAPAAHTGTARSAIRQRLAEQQETFRAE